MSLTDRVKELVGAAREEARLYWHRVEEIARLNHKRVLNSFREVKVSEVHLRGSTGYGYGDSGRQALEELYARVFGCEAALVRAQIVSGTHAIALVLFGILRPGDRLLAIQGPPYDTVQSLIGLNPEIRGSGTLQEWGIEYHQLDLGPDGSIDLTALAAALKTKPRMVYLQRSRGYSLRPPLSVREIARLSEFIRQHSPQTIIFVDNCYGEFVEDSEPTHHGVDIMAGSLIKNPGGGLVPYGGYVVGRRELVELAACRLTAPGLGSEVGASPDWQRLLFQGLYLAPLVVAEALKGAIFTASLFSRAGFPVYPRAEELRADIIQAIVLGSAERLLAFCRALQAASPVDSHVVPQAAPMPGYSDAVVMAAGTFVQGASLELSADAPLRPPYTVYVQGGLSAAYVELAVQEALTAVLAVSNN